MTTGELIWVRERQKEFEQQFGKKLYIDFPLMNNTTRSRKDSEAMLTALEKIAKAHGTSIASMKECRRMDMASYAKERKAFIEYCKVVAQNTWHIETAMSLLGRGRSNFWQYGGHNYRDK